jgi:subtilisin family serine protease
MNHPDLAANARPELSYDFELGITNGFHRAEEDNHGTQTTGLVAATLDGYGMAGIAPAAKFASWNIYPTNEVAGRSFVTPDKMGQMFQYKIDTIQVQLHNWNEVRQRLKQVAADPLELAGIEKAINEGRAGKGVVMVRPAGNAHYDPTQGTWFGRNANDSPFTSDPRAIAVAAARINGRVCSYSERGACILAAGFSGDPVAEGPDVTGDGIPDGYPNIFTTDRVGTDGANVITFPSDPILNDYVFDALGFSGTSASAPMVAGICALIVSANPNLTYRDVQQVLIHACRHIDRADPDLRRNGAGYWVSHRVGFGIPDAGEAVRVAESWQNRPAMVRRVIPSDVTSPQAIP